RGKNHGNLMRVGSDRFQIVFMGEKGIRGSREGAAEIRRHGIDHVFLPEEAMAAASSEVGDGEARDAAQALDLAPEFRLRPRVQNIKAELAQSLQRRPGFQFVEDGKRVK